jgi:hypothetical protein
MSPFLTEHLLPRRIINDLVYKWGAIPYDEVQPWETRCEGHP